MFLSIVSSLEFLAEFLALTIVFKVKNAVNAAVKPAKTLPVCFLKNPAASSGPFHNCLQELNNDLKKVLVISTELRQKFLNFPASFCPKPMPGFGTKCFFDLKESKNAAQSF